MSQPAERVYLDVCALCRPFDDQAQMRVRLETEAVQLILSYVRTGNLILITSTVHTVELSAIGDPVERAHLLSTLAEIGVQAEVQLHEVRRRAEELSETGLGPADAAHLAFAEATGASFVTCDDRLVRQCRRAKSSVWCGNPVKAWGRSRLPGFSPCPRNAG
jgi:predicted nucleic acid-binding protein